MKKFLYDEIANRWLNDCDSIWIYSDPHFGDLESYKFRHTTDTMLVDDKNYYQTAGNIWEDEDSLKCSMDCFDEWQIKNINSKAGKNSCLIILGDVGNLECVKKLRAKRKILIMGNHDKGASNYKRAKIFTPSQTFMNKWNIHNEEEYKKYHSKVIEDFGINHHETTDLIRDAWNEVKYIDNHLFDEVYEGPIMINDRTILSHEPVFAGVPYFKNIHGHVHKADYKGDEHHLNCCAEAINYEPINLLSLFKKGFLKNIDSIHRMTIDTATARKRRK